MYSFPAHNKQQNVSSAECEKLVECPKVTCDDSMLSPILVSEVDLLFITKLRLDKIKAMN